MLCSQRAIRRIVCFHPDFLVIALGFDTGRGDPTGTWSLGPDDFVENGCLLGSLRLPILVIQEGGYDTGQLGEYALRFFSGLWQGTFGRDPFLLKKRSDVRRCDFGQGGKAESEGDNSGGSESPRIQEPTAIDRRSEPPGRSMFAGGYRALAESTRTDFIRALRPSPRVSAVHYRSRRHNRQSPERGVVFPPFGVVACNQ